MAKTRRRTGKRRTRRGQQGAPVSPSTGARLDSRVLLLGAALLALVAAAFWPTLFAAFVWDDKAFFDAPPVGQWGGLAAIWLAPAQLPFEAHYWPMLYTSFWLDHKLWGFDLPGGFHLTNMLLHGINAVLLWRLLQRLALPGAWFVAAVFALHPVHVEAVAWVMSRKDLLGTLFYLLTVFCWLEWRGRLNENRLWRSDARLWYGGMLLCFAAGMLSKTFVITLPAALLIWCWWKQGTIRQRDLLHCLPLFLVGALIAYIGLNFYLGRAEINFSFSWPERLIIAAKALWFYAGQLLWPLPLMVIYPHWDMDPLRLLNWLPLIGALAVAAGLWFARHRTGRGPLAGALFFAVTLSPMLGFGNNSYMEYSFVADRYQYLAGTGLVAVVTVAAVMLYRSLVGRAGLQSMLPAIKGALTLLLAALLSFYGYLTWRQTWVYENEIALFSHIIEGNPTAHSANYNLGIALMEQGRLQEAEAAYLVEVERTPEETKYLEAVRHLASVYFGDRDYEGARRLYQYSAEVDPTDADTHQNLGSALAQLGRYQEALLSFQRALELDPELEMARANMRLAQEMLDAEEAP